MKAVRRKTISLRKPVWIAGIFGGLILAIVLLISSVTARMSEIPADLDYSTTRLSDNGLYLVTYTAAPDTIPVNQMHQWTLHVETSAGRLVENATITVDGDMPQHRHGLPTRPQITRYLGNGDYLVEGLKFQMGGWWVMDFSIQSDGQNDVVHFNLMLK
jgi:hypothetical protein